MEIGDKVTISDFGFTKKPGTVISKTKSGKTITVRENKFETEKRNTGPMVLRIIEIHEDEFQYAEKKYRLQGDGESQYWSEIGGYSSLMKKPGWDDLQLDIGL